MPGEAFPTRDIGTSGRRNPTFRAGPPTPRLLRENDDGFPEARIPSAGVREHALVEHLKKEVEDAGMCLLNFVEQENAVWLGAHRIGESAAFIVPDVTRRRADELRDGVLLHVFAHVEAQQAGIRSEEEFRERLGQFRFTGPRGASEEQNRRRVCWDPSGRTGHRGRRRPPPQSPAVVPSLAPRARIRYGAASGTRHQRGVRQESCSVQQRPQRCLPYEWGLCPRGTRP